MEIVALNNVLPSLKETFAILKTFGLTMFAWIFFRSDNIGHAFQIIKEVFSSSLFSKPTINDPFELLILFVLLFYFIIQEWIGRKNQYAIESLGRSKYRGVRWIIYLLLFTIIILLGGSDQEFIYFQF